MAINNALYTGSAVTISSTEYSLVNSSTSIATVTTDVIAQVQIDTANMAAGDEYEVALQEKVISGGTQRRSVLANLIGAQSEPFISPTFLLGEGWDFTLKKIAGSDRAFSWSIRAVT